VYADHHYNDLECFREQRYASPLVSAVCELLDLDADGLISWPNLAIRAVWVCTVWPNTANMSLDQFAHAVMTLNVIPEALEKLTIKRAIAEGNALPTFSKPKVAQKRPEVFAIMRLGKQSLSMPVPSIFFTSLVLRTVLLKQHDHRGGVDSCRRQILSRV